LSRSTSDARPLNILLIEDNPGDARLIRAMLEEAGDQQAIRLLHVDRLVLGVEQLQKPGIDVVLLDLGLPDSYGLETFVKARVAAPRLPIVVMSGQTDSAVALRAVQEGAQDYLLKGHVDPERLVRALRYAIEHKRIEERQRFLAEASRKLAGSLDFEATLEQVVRLPVSALADMSLVSLTPDHSSEARVEVHDVDAERASRIRRWAEPLGADLTALGAHLPEVGLAFSLVVPLTARGRSLGQLYLARSIARDEVDAEYTQVVEDLALRSALALDNARLHRELQGALHLRDEVLATTSHDLRSPLIGIRMEGELLLRRLRRHRDATDTSLHHEIARGLGDIDSTIGRALGLIDELLDVAALQAGRQLQLERREVDLSELARQIVAQHQARTRFHQLCLMIPEAPVIGEWDAGRLARVVDNLLGNAIKYSPGADTIRVNVAREGDWAVLRVEDHGVGIPADELGRVFDRFYRGSNVPPDSRGSGIGLHGVRKIVEQHGGTLSVESRGGEGSTFTVRLPVQA
jgi:signal transduction histidine kinase/DNA-binding NarL/FixJ family response regulator